MYIHYYILLLSFSTGRKLCVEAASGLGYNKSVQPTSIHHWRLGGRRMLRHQGRRHLLHGHGVKHSHESTEKQKNTESM